jgi:hypothetical protein
LVFAGGAGEHTAATASMISRDSILGESQGFFVRDSPADVSNLSVIQAFRPACSRLLQ